jgi:hypothetical protein
VAWWYEPSSGKATALGSFAASGSRSFTPPTGGSDWVLVVDSSASGFGAPGTVSSSTAVPALGAAPALALALVLGALVAWSARRARAR